MRKRGKDSLKPASAMRVTRAAISHRAPRAPKGGDAPPHTRRGFHGEKGGVEEAIFCGRKPPSSGEGAGEGRRVDDLGTLIPPHGDPSPSSTASNTQMRVLRRRRRFRASPGARVSVAFIVGVLRMALGLLFVARLMQVEGSGGGRQGSGGGGGGGGYKAEWQHPSSRPRTSGNPWAGGDSTERVTSGGVGGPGRTEEGGGRRGGRGADTLEAEEARGWSERKRSESMREIIELAKADAKAVRAAAEDAAALAADTAEAEAAWAAAGVGSGGGGGDNAMLFLECEVNGCALKAFVDTGAQVTVMSKACAERCGLTSLIDTRFAGRAVGVGFARILGRIHDANIRIGNSYLRCSFTVIEHGEIDLLVGLDVLRAHRCDISLSKNRMKFHAGGGAREVAFLTRLERDKRPQRTPPQPSVAAKHTPRGKDRRSPSPPPPHRFDGSGEDETPPPRVLREMARGTRGDGIPPANKWRNRRSFGDNTDGGDAVPPISPRKMRGWPPRGGEELELEEVFPKAREWSRRRNGGVSEGRAY